MASDWDFYLLQVDEQPASIFVDLGAINNAPMAQRPYMAYLSVLMNDPRPDGLSSQAEYDLLCQLENALDAALCDGSGTYVGRCTAGGHRDFVFYIQDDALWEKRVADLMSAFPAYKYSAGAREDRDWKTYLDFLYPSPEDHRVINDRRVAELLKSEGDTLELPREIDYWAYFPDQQSCDSFIAEAMKLGFSVRDQAKDDEGARPFKAQLWRLDAPGAAGISLITGLLSKLAAAVGGKYDGWESPVVSS